MKRRDFLGALSAAAVTMPFLSVRSRAATAPRAKITDIKTAHVKLVEHLGTFLSTFHTPVVPQQVNIGDFNIVEVYSDQGLIGMGPASSPAVIEKAKAYLIGKDPFDVEDHSRFLNVQGRPGNAIEIALWDLCGKLANLPLYKLWGGGLSRVMPYGATLGIGDGPEERGRAAGIVKSAGFKAVKMRASFPTMKEDVLMMTLARKAIGDDTLLIVDANKAGPYEGVQMVTLWDYQRAYETAMEFEKLNTYWLEEPLGRYDYVGLAKLHDDCKTMRLAGGENNTRIEDFLSYLQHDCYDILNLDAGQLGPTLYRQAMDLAFSYGKRVVPHAGSILQVMCQLHLAAIAPQPTFGRMDKGMPHLEVGQNPPLQDHRKLWSVFTNAPKLDADGWMTVPTDPGLGVTIRPELIERA